MITRTYSVTLSEREEDLLRAWARLEGHGEWTLHQALQYVLGMGMGQIAIAVVDEDTPPPTPEEMTLDQQVVLGSLEEYDESFPAAPGS